MHAGALGLLETVGLVPLTAGIEAMCKTADVECVMIERVSGGVLVAAVRGDVGSVEHATRAGVTAARRYGEVRGARVYPNPQEASRALLPIPGQRLAALGHPDGSR